MILIPILPLFVFLCFLGQCGFLRLSSFDQFRFGITYTLLLLLDMTNLILNLVFSFSEEAFTLRFTLRCDGSHLLEHFLELLAEVSEVFADLRLWVKSEEGLAFDCVIV